MDDCRRTSEHQYIFGCLHKVEPAMLRILKLRSFQESRPAVARRASQLSPGYREKVFVGMHGVSLLHNADPVLIEIQNFHVPLECKILRSRRHTDLVLIRMERLGPLQKGPRIGDEDGSLWKSAIQTAQAPHRSRGKLSIAVSIADPKPPTLNESRRRQGSLAIIGVNFSRAMKMKTAAGVFGVQFPPLRTETTPLATAGLETVQKLVSTGDSSL